MQGGGGRAATPQALAQPLGRPPHLVLPLHGAPLASPVACMQTCGYACDPEGKCTGCTGSQDQGLEQQKIKMWGLLLFCLMSLALSVTSLLALLATEPRPMSSWTRQLQKAA